MYLISIEQFSGIKRQCTNDSKYMRSNFLPQTYDFIWFHSSNKNFIILKCVHCLITKVSLHFTRQDTNEYQTAFKSHFINSHLNKFNGIPVLS